MSYAEDTPNPGRPPEAELPDANLLADVPDGVTFEDAKRIGQLANKDRRPSTRRVYESKWRLFKDFCEGCAAEALPASPEIVAAYLSKRTEEVSLSTIRQDVAVIR